MQKRKKGRKLSRESGQRKALLKSIAASLFERGKVTTSEAKAKAVVNLVDRLITKAKKKDLTSVKELSRFLTGKIVKKLTDEIAPKYMNRKGGYTRIYKLGPRKSDSSQMAIIELVK